eukprot:m.285891 g.285891  ORF g.285891 m.285891 type:complete len:555 (+) comp16345_c0_seq1:171-1835(+)
MQTLIAFTLLVRDDTQAHQDMSRQSQYTAKHRPFWLNSSLEYNLEHAERNNFSFEVLTYPAEPLLEWQTKDVETKCSRPNAVSNCVQVETTGFHRQNANWLKLKVILEYLEKDAASHVLFLDADVIMHTKPKMHPTKALLDLMLLTSSDMMFADEDWDTRKNATGFNHVNGGVILSRNCNWTKYFLKQLLEDHHSKKCGNNEQICFRESLREDRYESQAHVHVASAKIFNMNPNWGPWEDSEVIHFMGGAKPGLEKLDIPSRGRCPDNICIDIGHCAHRSVLKGSTKTAFIVVKDLEQPAGWKERFGHHTLELKAISSVAKHYKSDFIMLIPPANMIQHPLNAEEKSNLESFGVKIVNTEWIIPPGVHRSFPLCSNSSYLFMHAFGMIQYSAVVLLKDTLGILTGIHALLSCASQGRFLSSILPDEIDSDDVLAFQPSKTLFTSALKFASSIQLVQSETGSVWGELPHEPGKGCSQGFLWALLHGSEYASIATQSFEASNFKRDHKFDKYRPRTGFLDRCMWSRRAQDQDHCPDTCSSVKLASLAICQPHLKHS